MFFSITTQHFLNKGKKRKQQQPFRSNSTAFIIVSRTVYARIRCEQITAFKLLKLLQEIIASSDANQHWYERHNNSGDYCVQSQK